ncbi:MAG: serine hydrolase [Flavobacteriales bacterium]
MNRRVVLVAGFFITTLVSVGQRDTAGFIDFVQKAQVELGATGLAMSVTQHGKMVFEYGGGVINSEAATAPSVNTQFAIASLSKAFTACAIGMLVDEGKLHWDDPVIKHLPAFSLSDSLITKAITVEDILSHRSGLETFDGDLLWYGTTYSREEVVQRITARPLSYGLGEKFGYQNIMFITAGLMIEAVSGKTWDEFVKTRILEPLEMNRTTSDFETFMTDLNHAAPHIDGKEIFMLSYNNSGATAALNSTVKDLSKWIKFWLDDGVNRDGDTLISRESIERIWTNHIDLAPSAFDKENGIESKAYGMGWFLMDYHGKRVIHHGGGLPGYISKIAMVPEQQLGLVVLTNDMSSASSMLMYAVMDWVDGRDYTHWLEKFRGFRQNQEKAKEEAERERLGTRVSNPRLLPIEDYIGTYQDEMYGDARIVMGERDELVLTMLPSKELFTGDLEPWSDHAFRFDHNDPFLTWGLVKFEVKLDVVEGFTIDLPNDDFHFEKLNFKKVSGG